MTVGGSNEWDAGDDPGPIPPRAANPRYRLGKELTLKAGDLNPPWGPLGERPGENTRRATVQNLLEGGNGAVTPALNASDGGPISIADQNSVLSNLCPVARSVAVTRKRKGPRGTRASRERPLWGPPKKWTFLAPRPSQRCVP